MSLEGNHLGVERTGFKEFFVSSFSHNSAMIHDDNFVG